MPGEDGLMSFCKSCSTLVIYGAGKFGAILERFLRKKNISISCFCVTQMDEKESFLGYPVKAFSEIERNLGIGGGIVVAVSEKFAGEILERVKGLHYFYDREFLLAIVKDALEEEATSAVKIVGNMLCSAGEMHFREDTTYIVCPASIGDTLYVASLVKEYKRRNGICSVVLVVRKNHGSIADLFPSVDGCIVSDEIVEILDSYSRIKAVWELDNYLHGYERVDFYCKSYGCPVEAKNFLSWYKGAVMGLGEDAELEEMHVDRDVPVPDMFGRKTIIVMPHELSAKRLPLSFWEEFCEELGQNYTVYTNTKDETEQPIKGTKAISESLKDMANICEHCLAAISIRTGMCDLLAFTRCNLVVLNTEHRFAGHWNLKTVFERDNIVNVDCYGEFDAAFLKNSIMAHLNRFSLHGPKMGGESS